MDIPSLFESQARRLFWHRLEATHLSDVPVPAEIAAGKAYFSVRLCEMYLATARKLWRQIYPMLHCYQTVGSAPETHAIVSPAHLTELGDANLDRLANLNVRLSGPTPYNGEEVSLLAGLYAIPGHDSSKVLIDVLSSFAAMDPAAVGRAVSLSGLIRTGVESILGLDQAQLHLGVRDSFSEPAHPLQSGYFVGVGAADGSVDASMLWVREGRLVKGKDAASAMPYTDHDYMLIAIEKLDSRDDWRGLPELQDSWKRMGAVVGDAQFSVSEKRARLAAIWPAFVQTLGDSPNLTEPDRGRVAALTATDLLGKLKMQGEVNPFL